MRDYTSCPQCQKIERFPYAIVVLSRRPERLYYCASCDHSWIEDDETIASDEVPPKRSRDTY